MKGQSAHSFEGAGRLLRCTFLFAALTLPSLFWQDIPRPHPVEAAAAPALPPAPAPQPDFRQLLAMSPPEREKALASRSEAHQQVLRDKIREYEALSPVEREARLC